MKQLIDRNTLVARLVATCCLGCEDISKCSGCNVMDTIATVRDMPVLDERPSIGDKVWRYRMEGIRVAPDYDWHNNPRLRKTSTYITSWHQLHRIKFDDNMKLVVASERCDSDSRRYSEIYHRSLDDALKFAKDWVSDSVIEIVDEDTP